MFTERFLSRLSLFHSSIIIVLISVSLSVLFIKHIENEHNHHAEVLREKTMELKKQILKVKVTSIFRNLEQRRRRHPVENGPGDELLKHQIKERIRATVADGNEYMWINKIINPEGGDGYAVRLVHPNKPETEGMLLSTNIQDVRGNTPYRTELEGVLTAGEV